MAVSGCDAHKLVEMQWTLLQTLETLNWTLICLIRARGVFVEVEGPKIYCYTQPAIACSKLTIETLEQGVKYVQS